MADENPPLTIVEGGAAYPRGEAMAKITAILFGEDSKSFLGSGVGMAEYMRTMDFLRYQRCIVTQPKHEKQRRLDAIVRLGAEKERIVAASGFATAWCDWAIEAILEGDWEALERITNEMRFNDERITGTDHRHHYDETRKLFASFVQIAQTTFDTRPRVYCPTCLKPLDPERLNTWHDRRHECTMCRVVFDAEGNWVERDKARLTTIEGGK